MSKNKDMWITNKAGHDIFLEDINVTVKKGRTVNPFTHNPYLTESKFSDSLESGSLRIRIAGELVSVSKRKPSNPIPHGLNSIGQSTPEDFVEIKRISKTAVVVDTKEMEVLDDDDLGGIADYGFDEDTQAKVVLNNNTVIVEQVQDVVEESKPDAKIEMETIKPTHVSGNVIVANVKSIESDDENVAKSVVVEAPKDVKPAKKKKAKRKAVKVEKHGDAVVVGETPADLEDAEPFTSTFDAQMATKDETGAIVMKVKATEKEESGK